VSAEDDKERKACIKAVEPHGWHVARVTRKGYTLMRCSCGEHQESLSKTPSDPHHYRNKTNRMIEECSTG
jgi:hypothetical protein